MTTAESKLRPIPRRRREHALGRATCWHTDCDLGMNAMVDLRERMGGKALRWCVWGEGVGMLD